MAKQFLFKMAESLGALRLARYIFKKEPLILMYHRIVDDPLLPGITPQTFEQQLRHLKKYFNVLPMSQLAENILNQDVKPYSVAITFDDGHCDFYTKAWPLLQKYELPAALYVTTGFVDQKCWLWPDLLRYLLIKTSKATLHLDNVGYLPLDSQHLLLSWNKLGDYCLTLSSENRWEFLKELSHKLEVDTETHAQPPFNSVTWDQLREMVSQGLEVGSHTVSHPILTSLSLDDASQELAISHERILSELGIPPKGICYPNGMSRDISEQLEVLSKNWYSYGLAAYPAGTYHERIMRLGRYATTTNLNRFKMLVAHITRDNNKQGEYR
jgi:peptidoglycan/xylan/chitin deacetylase (PgdA/CDA1 family)